jgi:thiosulfate/3-mercaptopyruvate sulfurtransferase
VISGRMTDDGGLLGAGFSLLARTRRRAAQSLPLLALLLASVIRHPSPLEAQSQQWPPVISSDWLGAQLARPGVVVLHVGSDSSYRAGHIPGALHLDFTRVIAAPPVEGGLRMELPNAEALQSNLRALGVREDSRIVLVFDAQPRMLQAGRAFFTLEWAGLRGRVAVLDGGLPAWRASQRTVASGTGRAPIPGDVTLRPNAALVVTRDSAVAAVNGNGAQLIDARTAEFFTPTELGGGPNGGHIESAVSLPFTSVTDAEGRFKPKAEIERLLIATGVIPGERAVAYCNTGFQASWVYLALRHIGREVQLYDGSYEDWSRAR